MMQLEEIRYPKPEIPEPDGECPKCDGDLYHGTIPCPSGISGCCVLHYGYSCWSCGAVFRAINEKNGSEDKGS